MSNDRFPDDDFFLGLNRPNSVTPSESASQIGRRRKVTASSTVTSSSESTQPSSATPRTLRHRGSIPNLPKIPELYPQASNSPSQSAAPVEAPPQDLDDLIPLPIALSRAEDTKCRFATTHEGLSMAATILAELGILPADHAMLQEIKEFDTAIFARYSAARFLWDVLNGIDEDGGEWLGKGKKFDDSIRRIRTLKGLEGSLRCWEAVVLEILGLVDGGEVDREELMGVIKRWRVGIPSRP